MEVNPITGTPNFNIHRNYGKLESMSNFKTIFFIFALFLCFITPPTVSAQETCTIGAFVGDKSVPVVDLDDLVYQLRVTLTADDNRLPISLGINGKPIPGSIVSTTTIGRTTSFTLLNTADPRSLSSGLYTFTAHRDGTPSQDCRIQIDVRNKEKRSVGTWEIVTKSDGLVCEEGLPGAPYEDETACKQALPKPECILEPQKPKEGSSVSFGVKNSLASSQPLRAAFEKDGTVKHITNPTYHVGGEWNFKLVDRLPTEAFKAYIYDAKNKEVCSAAFQLGTSAGGIPCVNGTNGIQTAIGCIHTAPVALVKDLLIFTTAIGGGLAFLMMLLGAFQMLTSAGNPDSLNAGRERLTSAVIGLLFIIFSILLLRIIGFDILKLEGFNF